MTSRPLNSTDECPKCHSREVCFSVDGWWFDCDGADYEFQICYCPYCGKRLPRLTGERLYAVRGVVALCRWVDAAQRAAMKERREKRVRAAKESALAALDRLMSRGLA